MWVVRLSPGFSRIAGSSLCKRGIQEDEILEKLFSSYIGDTSIP